MNSSLDSIFKTDLLQRVSVPFWSTSDTSIFIYGTGTTGQDVYQVLKAKGIPIAGYMDHRVRENPLIGETPILIPDSPHITKKEQATIILAIHNREVNMPQFITQLKALGYTQFVTMIDLYDYFAAELGNRYWLTSRTFYKDFETLLYATHQIWADDLSRETFSKTIQFRVSGDFSLLPEPDVTHQYFPTDLPRWEQPIRMIDCGAYDGDAIRNLIENGHTFSALAAFEPDLQNYSRLASYLKTYGKNIPEVSLWPCGVHAESGQLRFASGMGEASGITASGETVIQCVALDDALPNFAPSLIKMDIEGAEMDALMGAHQLIQAHQPALAISAYHTPAHLWEIPLWVAQYAAENGLHYTYYLRAHAYNCFDTVFYAVPTP